MSDALSNAVKPGMERLRRWLRYPRRLDSQHREMPIVLFDGSPEFQTFVRLTLELHGFEVIEAVTTEAARERIQRHEAALLVIGEGANFEEGVELSVWAKQTFPAFPLIMVAGAAYPVGVQDGYAILLHPVTSEELLSAVHKLLEDLGVAARLLVRCVISADHGSS